MYLTCFQSLQWLIANSVIIMADKGPFLVEAWAPWKIWGGHLPPPQNGASVLKPFKNPNKKIYIVNTHLLYNRKREDIRLAQLQILLAEINRVACKNATYFPVILCGNLNLTPSSNFYSF